MMAATSMAAKMEAGVSSRRRTVSCPAAFCMRCPLSPRTFSPLGKPSGGPLGSRQQVRVAAVPQTARNSPINDAVLPGGEPLATRVALTTWSRYLTSHSMTILPILIAPDPRLKQVSQPVAQVTDELRKLMDDMLDTMYDAPGIGLAAIQVGVGQAHHRHRPRPSGGRETARTSRSRPRNSSSRPVARCTS
jgi:hypothetical protein